MSIDEAEAVARLYERYAGAVHAYALRRSDRESADEVTAQVFLVAWRRRGSVPEEALPWLYGVARRVLADQRRGASRRRRLGERLRNVTTEHYHELALPDRVLAGALRRLSASDREVLLLCYWEELEPLQMAQVMGCSRAAVAVRLHRARQRLARELQRDEQERSCVVGAQSS
ncbi:MAG TPA: sigma-70 family RNA polymerase sigma factor [Solirubrobacteraceae bacterium]